ncbi:low temperature requirement protein A [Streptomyces sp. NBC_01304]|uniref:low temperature requirement protein A n=1 Tax=Streptomyces sp. NBC_01304 TaxID=2903818 RepID=UPI002E0E39A5|nr:low temperature requirement protein A [Streptomyces sp. NBC_01304]
MVATDDAHRVTSAELFFDLVFVYAITQVTALMAHHTSAELMLGGFVVLALLWWCWCCFSWLGNVVRADSGAMFGVLVAVMAVVLVVSLTVPEVFEDKSGGLYGPLVFVVCYGAVRLLHLATYWVSDPDDQALHATIRRTAMLSVAPPFVLLLVGSFFTGLTQILIWLAAVVVDYSGIYITGSKGWRVASPGHFAERHGLIVIIALGESIVAIGVGVAAEAISVPVIVAAATGLLVVAGLWRLYFQELSERAEHAMSALTGDARTVIARDTYTFLHLPLVAGVVFAALGMKKALHQIADNEHYALTEPLHGLVAWSLTGGVGVFLLGAAAILWRVGRRPSWVLVAGGLGCLAAGALVVVVPALAALGLLAAAVLAVVLLQGRSGRRAAPVEA